MRGLVAFGLSAGPVIILLASFASAPARADPKVVEFRLTAKGLDCLKKHAGVYRRAKRSNLFIPVRECPRLPSTPALGSLVNQGPGGQQTGSTEDTFIFVTKAQFECLIGARPRAARAYRFLPQSCALDPVP